MVLLVFPVVVVELDDFFLDVVVPPVLVLPVVVVVSSPDSDVLSADELCVSVEELSAEEALSLLLLSEESELLSFLLLSSLGFFLSELSENCPDNDELVVDTRLAPSLVFVTLLVTTLVAPSANAIDKIANGVINGGVRYAMSDSSLCLTR